MRSSTRLLLSRTHRRIGLLATIPLVGWVASSFVLHGVGLALPNGLQGEYDLQARAGDVSELDLASLQPPSGVLSALAAEGIARLYWLRLEVLGGRPAYVAKPGPFELERVYDARTGERMDPLPDALLRRIADEELQGTRAALLAPGDEFNRYYTLERVPAVAATMEGDQPSEIVLSRASGRVLRRTDPLAAWFAKAYRSVHVWQWGDRLRLFTALLYGLVGLSLMLVVLGYVLWFDRRDTRRRWSEGVRPARRLHARLAPWAGVVVSTQMLVGAYLWFNLGLIEPRFRGQGSFAETWSGGVGTHEALAPPSEVMAALDLVAPASVERIHRVEWRAAGEDRLWLVYPERVGAPVLLNARTGARLDRLDPGWARVAAEGVVQGSAVGAPVESTEYWMDTNERVPTWRFRFTDPDDTDVHVAQWTGEVIQRRPAIWRAFGPFLAYHTFGFSGNPWVDTGLLSLLQLTVLGMVVTGWRLALVTRRNVPTGAAGLSADLRARAGSP